MTECPVCGKLITDASPSPFYCCQDCQEVYSAGLASPLGDEPASPVTFPQPVWLTLSRAVQRDLRVAGRWERWFVRLAVVVAAGLSLAFPAFALVRA